MSELVEKKVSVQRHSVPRRDEKETLRVILDIHGSKQHSKITGPKIVCISMKNLQMLKLFY